METRIHKTLYQWFPDAFSDDKKSVIASDYITLRRLAKYEIKLINDNCENKTEPFKIINLLYSEGTLYEKNTIENEFLKVIATEEKSMTLNEHLNLMPESLRSIYLKVILQN